jgi:hypothetical protein
MKNSVFPVLLALALAAGTSRAAAEVVNVDDFPHLTITLPDKSKAELIKYQDRDWRVAKASILTGEDDSAGDVCFDGKFESLTANKLKLLGDPGTILIEDKTKLKKIKELQLGDNIWVCGTLRKEGKALVCYAAEVLKQLPDVERYRIRIDNFVKAGSHERLLTLGYEIDEQKKNNKSVDINSFDKFSELRDRAWERALTLWEGSIKRDDADELFAIACKWRDLLRKKAKFQALATTVLQIDPNHQGAGAIAERELGLKRFENKWLPPVEIERVLQERKRHAEMMSQAQKDEQEARERARLQAIAERPALLLKYQAAMRTGNVAAREGAIKSLGEAVEKSLDKGFGDEAVDILANLSETDSVLPGLEYAALSAFPETRAQVYEALVWRGRQKNAVAFDILQRALKTEKDAAAARGAASALAALGGKPAAQTLIGALSVPDQPVRDEYIDGLKSLAKQQLGTKEAWENWWAKNKDTLEDASLK